MPVDRKDVPDPTLPQASGDKKKQDVSDYLSTPRRKRRSHVVVACGKGVSPDVQGGIDQFVKTSNKQLAISHPRTREELVKLFARQIVLLVFDDEFCDLETGLNLIGELKRKKNPVQVPVLFLTRHPDKLVEAYNKLLLPFHESDDYIDYGRAPLNQILSKVRTGLQDKNRRRSRRYKVDLGVSYFVLEADKTFPATLVDLSLHGAMIKADDGRLFAQGEQLKIHVPVEGILASVDGDFLKLSARVRRVFIGGDQAGVSFEHVGETQLLRLTTFLTEMVNVQNARKAAALRAKMARP